MLKLHRSRISFRYAFVASAVAASGCASPTPVGGPGSSGPQAVAASNGGSQGGDARLMGQQTRWLIKTSEHVDLWIHAFAMLSTDSANVPLYRRGYRDSLTVVKNSANILTALDANRVQLASGLASSSRYLQAQFLPLDMPNWDVLKAFTEKFLLYEGDPNGHLTKAQPYALRSLHKYFHRPPIANGSACS